MNLQHVGLMASLLLLSVFLLPISAFTQCDAPKMSSVEPSSLPALPPSCYYASKNGSYVRCKDINVWDSMSYENVITLEISNWNSSTLGSQAFCSEDCTSLTGLIIKDSERLKDLHDRTFKGLTKLEYLVITRTSLQDVPVAAFINLPNIVRLHLHDNNISALSPTSSADEMALIFHSLEELKINKNNIKEIDAGFFKIFNEETLEKVSLRSVNLEAVGNGTFCDLNLLSHLDLSDVPDAMEDLEQALQCVGGLTNLILQSNRLRSENISRIVAPINDTLQVLSLDHNNLYSISDKTFPYNMHKLAVLSLVDCQIRKISNFSFSRLQNLRELHLKGNSLTTIPPALYIKSLMYLNLDNNPMSEEDSFSIDPGFSTVMTELRRLTLNGCKIKVLSTDTLKGLRNLTSLEISDSSLEEIHEYAFDNLSHLKKLELSGSTNFTIPSNFTFGGLPRLQYLGLSLYSQEAAEGEINGPIENIITATKPFASLNSLTHLDLSGHDLKENDGYLFWGLFQLKALKLRATGMSFWKAPFFSRFPVLERIDLSYNDIVELSDDITQDISGLTEVNLSHNQFNCLCPTLLNFQFLLEIPTLTLVNWKDPRNYMCQDTHVTATRNISITCAMEQYLQGCNPSNSTVDLSLARYIAAPVSFAVLLGVCVWKRRQIYYTTYLFWIRVKKRSFLTSFGDCMYDAFVCYCEEDKEWVYSELMLNMETKGFTLCLHERDFLVGKSVIENIVASIEHSRKIIIVMSKNFIQSRWCLFEVEVAQQRVLKEPDSNIIVVNLEQIPNKTLPTSVKYIVKTKTHISWTPDNESKPLFWAKLIRALKKTGSSLSSVSSVSDA